MDSAIDAEIVRDRIAIEALRPEWGALFESCDAEPSTSIEWTLALLDSHRREGDVTLICVLRQSGSVVAIVPMLIRKQRLTGIFNVTTLCFLSELSDTHSDILGKRDDPGVIAALFAAMATLPESWDLFQASRILSGSPLSKGLAAFLEGGAWRFCRRRVQPSFLLDLSGGFDEFLANRSSKFRNYLRRKSRTVESLGTVRIARAGHELTVEAAYGDLLQIEERSWKHPHGTAISAVSHQQRFYRSLCGALSEQGSLHLTVMYIGDRPIAYNLGLVHRRRYYYLKTSYDMELRSASPATVFRARLVAMLIAEGVESMDFPAEPYQWETQWTKDMRWHESVIIFNHSLKAMLLHVLIAARNALKLRRTTDGVEFADPRALRAR